MKKLSRILAVLLTVGLLVGIIAVSAAASTPRENNLIPVVNGEYLEHFAKSTTDFESDTVGDITTYSGWSGQQGGGDKTTLDWYIGGEKDGDAYANKYMNYLHYASESEKNAANTSTVQPYVKTGNWGTSDASCLDHDFTNAYDYLVVDFEIGTDRYKYFDGTKYVTYTPAELKAANLTPDSEGVSLALQDGQKIYAQIRGLKDASKGYWSKALVDENGDPILDANNKQKTDANGQSWSPELIINEIDGEFYIQYDASHRVKLSNALYDFDHVTIVIRTTARSTTDGVTACSYSVDYFVNGTYLGSYTRSGWQSLSVDFICFMIPGTYRNQDAYSVCIDNMTTNYYKMGYDSGDAYGLDDYYKTFSTSAPADITELDDIVYNYDYQSDRYVEYNGVKYYNEKEARKVISEIKGDAYITSTMALHDLEINDELKCLYVYGNYPVSLAPTDRNLIFFYDGSSYEIREPGADDIYYIEWYDPFGNLIEKTQEIFGLDIDTDKINPDYADKDAGVIYDVNVESWEIEIDGATDELYPIEFGDIDCGATVKATAKGTYTEISGVKLYVGEWSDETKLVRPVLSYNNDWAKYTDGSGANISAVIKGATDGETVVLTSDIDITGVNNVDIGAGEQIALDLNGYDVLRLYKGNAQPGACFILSEGSTLNIYSSREGGRIIDSGWYKKAYTDALVDGVTTTVATEDTSYSSGGFIATGNMTDECAASVGAFRGYAANIEYNGGTLFYPQGKNYQNGGDRNELVNDKKRTFTIDGGKYYMPVRCAYAFATTTGPDVVWNFKNAEFYVSQTTYSLLHDYDEARFSINTEAYIDNCKILSYNVDNISRPIYKYDSSTKIATPTKYQAGNVGDCGNIYHTIGSKSNVYITNTTAIGKIAHNVVSGGKIHLGEGNVINTPVDYKNASYITYMDGVYPVFSSSEELAVQFTLSFAHPSLYADYEQHLVLVDGAYQLIDGVFERDDVVASCTKPVSFITVKGNSIPEIAKDAVAPVNWYAPDGSLYKTTYAFIGHKIDKIAAGDFEVTELDNGWYDVGYGDWSCTTEGQSGAEEPVALSDKENKFAPKRTLIADIEGTKAKMGFYYSQYEFYFYFPKPAEDSGIIYIHNGSDTAEVNKTGWFSSQNINESSIPYNAASYLKSEGNYYYNWFYPEQDAADVMKRAIRFRVAEYDLNGDGSITDDEKDIVLVQNVDLSIPRYAELLVKYYDHGSEEANLSYELMRYMMESRSYIGKSVSFFEDYEAAYFAKCDCAGAAEKKCDHVFDLDSMDLSEETNDLGELSTVIHSVNFNLNISKPSLYIYLLPIDGEYTINTTLEFYAKSNGEISTVTNSLKATRQTTKDIKATLSDGTEVTLQAYSLNTKAVYWLIKGYKFTITANYTDEAKTDVTVTGTYGLADYIARNPDVRAAKALYAYAYAAWDYKTITSSEKAAAN